MPTIEQLFSSFTRAFRFEALSAYKIKEEAPIFEGYLKGVLSPSVPEGGWAGWLSSIKQWKANGKSVQRLRMLPTKFSPYVNCELEWAYPFNFSAGEEILVIPEDEVRKLSSKIPPDFWMFDAKYVAILKYSDQGEWQSTEILEVGADSYVALSASLLRAATDFTSYLGIKRQTGRFP